MLLLKLYKILWILIDLKFHISRLRLISRVIFGLIEVSHWAGEVAVNHLLWQRYHEALRRRFCRKKRHRSTRVLRSGRTRVSLLINDLNHFTYCFQGLLHILTAIEILKLLDNSLLAGVDCAGDSVFRSTIVHITIMTNLRVTFLLQDWLQRFLWVLAQLTGSNGVLVLGAWAVVLGLRNDDWLHNRVTRLNRNRLKVLRMNDHLRRLIILPPKSSINITS